MKTRRFSINDFLFLIVTLTLAFIVFIADIKSNESLSFSPLYSLIILFSWLIPYALTILTTALSSLFLLTTLVWQLKSGYDETSVILNGFIGFVVIIVTFVLTRITSNSSSELRKNNMVLNEMVDQRTSQLKRKIKELTDHQGLLEENKDLLQILHDELSKSEQRYQSMINYVQDYSIVFVEENGRLRNWNSGAASLRGYSGNDVLNRYFYEFILPENEELHLNGQEIIAHIHKYGSFENDGYRMKKDGSYIFTHDIISLIKGEDESTIGYSWITHDLTDLKHKEVEIEKLNRELESKVEKRTKELESFAYSVSHDLRAPLRAINGFTEIVLSEYATRIDDENFKRFLEIIHANAQKMSELIDDLLTFSRIGKKSVDHTLIDTPKMVKSIIHDLLLSHPEYQKCTIETDCDLPNITGDEMLVRQALTNLISNAFKYSAQKENPKVEIYCTQNDQEVVINIKDNGAGFDMKYQHKLFKVFQRLHDGNEFDGTGIGLAIVKQVVEAHNGRAWAEAELGKGATFHFALPVLD